MKQSDYKKTIKEIEQLEKEISAYPVGSISKKRINGKDRYYHQWYESGKTKSKYIRQDEIEIYMEQIRRRRNAEKRLKELKDQIQPFSVRKGMKSILNKELIASITYPLEITGLFNGKYIIPDKKIKPVAGQKFIVTIREATERVPEIKLDKYINHGEKLFKTDAQEYIRELRDEERI